MAHPREKRDVIRSKYIGGLTLEMAAVQAGVSINTVRRWKTEAKNSGDDWDRIKAANVLSGGSIEDIGREILSGFLVQYQSTMSELQTSNEITTANKAQLLASLADSFAKTIAANRRILPETQPLAIAVEVLGLLSDYIYTQHPEQRMAFVGIIEGFGPVLENKLSVR